MDRDLSEIAPEVFPEAPDRIALFPAAGQQRIVAALQQDVAAGRHLLCITGPAGSGKTVLLREVRQGFRRSLVGMIEQPVQGRLLFDVAKSLHLGGNEDNESSLRRALVMLLSLAVQQQRSVIQIVDAADTLTTEEINLLLHFFPPGHATLILAGRGAPETWLSGCPASAGDAHIDQCYHVDPLSAEETAAYIRYRLRAAALPEDLLEPAALALIHQRSGGVPGLINRFCADALAHAGKRTGVSFLSPTPTPEPPPPVGQDSRLLQTAADKISALEDTTVSVSERQRSAVPPAKPVITAQKLRHEPERLQRRMHRLQRSVRIWRALAILAGVAFTAELTRDAWLDRMPMAFASLWNHAGPSPVTAAPERALPEPVHARASDSPTKPAEPPDAAAGHADFAALHALPPEDPALRLLPTPTNDPETPLPQSTTSAPTAPESAPTPDAAPAAEPQQQSAKLDREGAGRVGASPSPAGASSRMTRAQRQEIARLYAERAEYEMRKGEHGAASLSIQRGLSTDPRNPRLLELRAKVLEDLRQP